MPVWEEIGLGERTLGSQEIIFNLSPTQLNCLGLREIVRGVCEVADLRLRIRLQIGSVTDNRYCN